MKKLVTILICLVIVGLGSTGCSQLTEDAKQKAEDLYASKVEYLGDNSAVSKLIEETGLGNLKDYSIQLETSQEPYGLIINVEQGNDTLSESDFSQSAVQLLGLIKNLDYVQVNNGDQQYQMTTEEASQLINENVKNLGDSKEKLESILNTLSGN